MRMFFVMLVSHCPFDFHIGSRIFMFRIIMSVTSAAATVIDANDSDNSRGNADVSIKLTQT